MPLTSASPVSITASRGLSLALGQGGGEASIAGTIAHGSIVTLNDPQNRLGTRTNAVFRHWQQGSEIVINGIESTAESGAAAPDTLEVWGGVSDDVDIVVDNLRHPRMDQQYRGLGKGSLTSSQAFDSIGIENKYYLMKWVYAGSDFLRMYVTAYGSLSGTFQTNAQRTRGEAVTISLSGGGTKSGFITMISGGFVSLEIAGGSGGAANIDGATVTGDLSGASLVIDSTTAYGSLGATKIQRTWSGEIPSGQGISVVTSHVQGNGLIDVDEYDVGGSVTSLANNSSAFRYSSEPKQWHLYELEIDFTGESGVVRERVDNGTIAVVSGLSKTNLSSVKGFYLTNIGLDTAGSPTIPENTGQSEDWGEIVADNELKRLVIGDAPVLADCTHIEIQNHTSWAPGTADFKVNQGSFDSLSGKYLFAVGGGFSELLQVAL